MPDGSLALANNPLGLDEPRDNGAHKKLNTQRKKPKTATRKKKGNQGLSTNQGPGLFDLHEAPKPTASKKTDHDPGPASSEYEQLAILDDILHPPQISSSSLIDDADDFENPVPVDRDEKPVSKIITAEDYVPPVQIGFDLTEFLERPIIEESVVKLEGPDVKEETISPSTFPVQESFLKELNPPPVEGPDELSEEDKFKIELGKKLGVTSDKMHKQGDMIGYQLPPIIPIPEMTHRPLGEERLQIAHIRSYIEKELKRSNPIPEVIRAQADFVTGLTKNRTEWQAFNNLARAKISPIAAAQEALNISREVDQQTAKQIVEKLKDETPTRVIGITRQKYFPELKTAEIGSGFKLEANIISIEAVKVTKAGKEIPRAKRLYVKMRDLNGNQHTVTINVQNDKTAKQTAEDFGKIYPYNSRVVCSGIVGNDADDNKRLINAQLFHIPNEYECGYPFSEKVVPLYDGDKTGIESMAKARDAHEQLKVLKELFDQGLVDEADFEVLPEDIIKEEGFSYFFKNLCDMHHPENASAFGRAFEKGVYENVFLSSLLTEREKDKASRNQAPEIYDFKDLRAKLEASLPFKLTRSQKRQLDWFILRDLDRGYMTRFLQGDVGAGKTLVAFVAALYQLCRGKQVALMAPTGILASQIRDDFNEWLEAMPELGIKAELLASSEKSKAKKLKADIKSGEAKLVVGTHALLSDDVEFSNLGLFIGDEEQKYGTAHKNHLSRQAENYLTMSATPIPATLSLAEMGVTSLSKINKPDERKEIQSFFDHPELTQGHQSVKLDPDEILESDTGVKHIGKAKILSMMKEELDAGRQAYVVMPRLGDKEVNSRLKRMSDVYAYIEKQFPDKKVAMLHGKMDLKTQIQLTKDFKAGKYDVLVATPVIEVGVSNPNASFMWIMDANAMGVASLQQIRGRVGRGSDDAYCVMTPSNGAGEEALAKLNFVAKENDGLAIAKYDLESRGAGNFSLLVTNNHNKQSGANYSQITGYINPQRVWRRASRAARHFYQGLIEGYKSISDSLKKAILENQDRYRRLKTVSA